MSENMYKLQYELNIQTVDKSIRTTSFTKEKWRRKKTKPNVEKTAAIIVRKLLAMICIIQIITNDLSLAIKRINM
jgi:hypothetical protein